MGDNESDRSKVYVKKDSNEIRKKELKSHQKGFKLFFCTHAVVTEKKMWSVTTLIKN